MSKCGSELKPPSLVQLRHYLDVYADALSEWRRTIDDADRQIASLTPDQAHLVADEIQEIRKNRSEYLALKKRVDEGWILYRRLSVDDDTSHQTGQIPN